MITRPHISTRNGDLLLGLIGQSLQVLDNSCFLTVSKKVNDLMVFDISDDATVLIEQVQFINSDACALDRAEVSV